MLSLRTGSNPRWLRDLRRSSRRWAWSVAWLGCAAVCCHAQVPVAPTGAPTASAVDLVRATGQAATLLGIVRYTRWPGGPRGPVLCVVGPGPVAADLANELGMAVAASPMTAGAPAGGFRSSVKAAASPHALPADCDAVVLAEGGEAEARALVARVATRPVLTIGTGPAFCRAGGQFCLHTGTAGSRFSVNTEALSRSGLVVNPMVLRMGRREEPR